MSVAPDQKFPVAPIHRLPREGGFFRPTRRKGRGSPFNLSEVQKDHCHVRASPFAIAGGYRA